MISSQFETTACLCKGKSTERSRLWNESVARVIGFFMRSPMKSVLRVSREIAITVTTVWKVLLKRLKMRPYGLQLLRTLKPTYYGLCTKFANVMLKHANENFMDYVIFRDEETFYLSEHVNNHNVRIWSLENTHEMLELQRDLPKLNVFCVTFRRPCFRRTNCNCFCLS
ncbi:uncharacterized protein TNCV_4181401 [Trichonephila clavipes]|nr:uncharacterized protein TNCV_4181401 [Trichonephila clavipes]